MNWAVHRGKGIPTQLRVPCPDQCPVVPALCFAARSLFIVSRISELHFVLENIFSEDAAVLVRLWLMLHRPA